MAYILLYEQNILPLNYNEQGIYPDDKSMSKQKMFFNKYNSLPVACKKWYDYILEDYDFFSDTLIQKVIYCTMSDFDIVKSQDINEIIYSINP